MAKQTKRKAERESQRRQDRDRADVGRKYKDLGKVLTDATLLSGPLVNPATVQAFGSQAKPKGASQTGKVIAEGPGRKIVQR
jgi:hypothetical protein